MTFFLLGIVHFGRVNDDDPFCWGAAVVSVAGVAVALIEVTNRSRQWVMARFLYGYCYGFARLNRKRGCRTEWRIRRSKIINPTFFGSVVCPLNLVTGKKRVVVCTNLYRIQLPVVRAILCDCDLVWGFLGISSSPDS